MAVGPFGSRMKADLYVPTGVRVIRGNNLSGGREPEGEYVYVSEATADSLASCCLKPGDLVFPHRGNIGEVGITPDDGLRYMLSTSLMKLSPDRKRAEPLYLMYFFKSAIGRAALLMNASQVGTPGIATPLKSLRGIQLPLPPLMIQRQIAETLSTLDDRITLLRETNATLEAIAQALFKSWFVDFDPVRAKMEGRAPEGMDEATAALFPDALEESELGWVPKGWRVAALSHLSKISSGARPNVRSDVITDAAAVPLFGGAGVMGFTDESLYQSRKILTGRVGTLGKVHISYPPFWASDNVLVLSPEDECNFIFCFHWLKSIDVHALNRGSTQPLLTQKDLGKQQHLIPDKSIMRTFSDTTESLYQAIRQNAIQAQTIATLRDTLLPRLISGQLRLPEAQALAAGV